MTLITRLRAACRLTRAIPPATTDATENASRASTATATMRLSGQRRRASARVALFIGLGSSVRGVAKREDGQVVVQVPAVELPDVPDHPVQQLVVGGHVSAADLAVSLWRGAQSCPDQVHQALAAEPFGPLPDPAFDQPVGVQQHRPGAVEPYLGTRPVPDLAQSERRSR